MTDDKIAEIRARHSRDDRWRNLPSMICPQAHDDRALLLAEIERLNKDLATQQGCCDGAAAQDAHVRREREEHRAEVEGLRADNERLFNEDTKTRHALKGWVFVCPDGGDEPTHERVAAVVAEVDRMRAENERLLQAIGLVTTTVPDMQVDIENPVGMMQRVVAEIERLRAEIDGLEAELALMKSGFEIAYRAMGDKP